MKRFLCVIVPLLVFLASCTVESDPNGPTPTPVVETFEIRASARQGPAPLTVTFTLEKKGTATGFISWDIGGETYSGVTQVTHTFEAPGSYQATATLESVRGEVIALSSVSVNVF